jgi:hypothetical protein
MQSDARLIIRGGVTFSCSTMYIAMLVANTWDIGYESLMSPQTDVHSEGSGELAAIDFYNLPHLVFDKTANVRIDVILRSVRVTTVALEKQ